MDKTNKTIFWSVAASETIHVFCCFLPSLFSILSLLSGFGLMATMPNFVEELHHIIHNFEKPLIILSAVVLIFGWGLYVYSRKINCRIEGACVHEPCEPKKDRTKLLMIGSTCLFFFNVSVYFLIH